MAKKHKLTDLEILAAVNAARDDALNTDSSDLVADRAEALDRYYGRPYGDEVEGRSAVVSRDVSDTVDWIMPSLIRIFAGGDSVLEFNPVGPEDEAQAQQETDYTNHVVTQENPWFLIAYDWFKDGLLLRNGYVKAVWDEYSEPRYSTYRNLSVEQLALVVGEDTEVAEKRENEDGTFDVKVRDYREQGRVCIKAVPPEEVIVSRNCRGPVSEAEYVEHRPPMTRSDLVAMGLPRDWVDGLPANTSDGKFDEDAIARAFDEDADDVAAYARDRERVDYREVYIRLDVDGDGVSELRRIVVCGNEIAPGAEWNTEVDGIPFASLSPNRVPHRHVGRSVVDEIEDLAKIKTTLWRQLLDNVYLTNNQRVVVNANVNLSDLLVSRPGGIVRTTGMPGADVVPLVTQPIVGQVAPVLEMVDYVKEMRTGVGRASQGLDADTLKQSTKGAYLAAVGQANQKIEMIARMFAETGVKDLFQLVHGLLLKNQDQEKVVRLRNTWVPVNPSEWRERYDLTVSVGLGTGTAEERIQKVQALAMGQAQLAPFGLVGPKEAYASFAEGVKAIGYKNASKFAMDPDSPQYQQMMASKPPVADPLTESKKIEVQGKLQAEQMRAQAEQPSKEADLMLRKYEIDLRAQLEREKAQMAARAEVERAAIEARQAEADRRVEMVVEQLKANVDLYIANLDAKMEQLGMGLKAAQESQRAMEG